MSEPLSLIIERVFDAPIEKVWHAWTDQKMLEKWSCPETFELKQSSGELVVGGTWTARMESKAMNYIGNLRGEYKEITPPTKLVSSHIWLDDNGNDGFESQYTVELTEMDGKTHMRFSQVGFESPESRDSHRGGWNESFNKLAHILQPRSIA